MRQTPTAKERSLSERRSTIGCATVSSRMTKTARPTMQRKASMRMSREPSQSLRCPVSRRILQGAKAEGEESDAPEVHARVYV